MKKLIIFLMVCFVVFSVRAAKAELINFTDTATYWPNWASPDSSDNSREYIGSPNFSTGTATVLGGWLTQLTFQNAVTATSIISPGDLFIDVGANQTWDLLVDLTTASTWTVPGTGNVDAENGDYNLYSLSVNLGTYPDNQYILSGYDNTGGWAGGYDVRAQHPVAANLDNIAETLIGTAHFSGWNSALPYTFNFSNGGLDLGSSGQFTIGWGTNCANDEIYNTLSYAPPTPPIPEPTSMLLLGMGILGLLGLRKKIS